MDQDILNTIKAGDKISNVIANDIYICLQLIQN